MVGLTVSLPEKWTQFLKHLADDHEIDVNIVVSELCEWVFSDSESKEQFMAWLDGAYPQKEKLKKKQETQEKKLARKNKRGKKNLKRNLTNTEISHKNTIDE